MSAYNRRMSIVESQSHRAVTEAARFDYGSSGRGGWDEASPVVESAGKRAKKECVPFDLDSHIASAGLQVRRAREIREMRIPRQGRGSHLGGIYVVENMVTKDRYVGESYNVVCRLKGHVQYLRRRGHPVPRMNALVRQHGLSSFRFIILEQSWSSTGEQRRIREATWAARLGPVLGCRHDNPRVLTLAKVAKVLGCKVDDLLTSR